MLIEGALTHTHKHVKKTVFSCHFLHTRSHTFSLSRTNTLARGESKAFPPEQDNVNIPYFSDNINFNAIDGQLLIGAA